VHQVGNQYIVNSKH